LKKARAFYKAASKLLLALGFTVCFLAISLSLIPNLYKPPDITSLKAELKSYATDFESNKANAPDTIQDLTNSQSSFKLPAKDTNLPPKNKLIIQAINLDTTIHIEEDTKEAMDQGIAIVKNYGRPDDQKPIIIAAHSYGYSIWSEAFRENNSFQNLHKTEIGDFVNVIWDQRKYDYQIEATSEGEEIKSYSYDLILYTCKSLYSEQKIFRYANRIN
jgi:sortase (surface protein transpeptidase)